MDDFEKAIIISFDQSSTLDPNLKAHALRYCEVIKQSTSVVQLCFERFTASNYNEVQFWCLQTLEDVIKNRYSSLDEQEKLYFRSSLLSILSAGSIQNENSGPSRRPSFVRNKLAHIFVMLVLIEYPTNWPSAFLELLSAITNGSMDVEMFCRIFIELDEAAISLDYPRRPEENVIAVRIKDAMREQCIPQIVKAWHDLIIFYKGMNEDITATVLDTVKRYVTWIDINLVANDNFLPLFFEFVRSEQRSPLLRGSAANCILAIVSKRMDPQAKVYLLRRLQCSQFCQLISGNLDPEFLYRLSSLVLGFAEELFECCLKLGSPETKEAKEAALGMLDEVLPAVFYIMQFNDEDVDVMQFLTKYVNKMKSSSFLTDKELVHIGQMLEVIKYRIRYDPRTVDALSIPDAIGKDEEERMAEIRRDLFTLFRTIGRVAPATTQNFVRNNLVSAITSTEPTFEDIEASISLFYALGETLSEETMKSESSAIVEMVQLLLPSRVPFHSHRVVALVFLETITRYVRFFQHHVEYAPLLLGAFLDDRGVRHPNQNVSGRASYLFMRIVKSLRTQLVPYIDNILQSLQVTLSNFTHFDVTKGTVNTQSLEDATYMFEAIGLLIGMEEVPLEKQSEHLSALLVPLCQRVTFFLADNAAPHQIEVGAKVMCLQQTISSINSLSKGFGERLSTASRPMVGAMFKQTLDVLLQVLVTFPKEKTLRGKVISFMHRMIDTLGTAVFPYLPKVIEQLLIESEPKEMVDFLVLINQLICKFKSAMTSILEEVFPFIASRVFAILPKDGIPSGPGSNTEEIRELQELQRTFFIFLQDLTTYELSAILVIPKCSAYLTQVIELLLNAACTHSDMLVRKVCVQIFIKLIKNWCTDLHENEKVPGFRKFIIENFAARCCYYSVLDSSFELRDANTNALFGEIVAAQKVIYEKCGDAFLIYLVTNILSPAFCPPDLAQQYCLELKRCDVKDLKTIYKSLVERLRMQQNGSVVFR